MECKNPAGICTPFHWEPPPPLLPSSCPSPLQGTQGDPYEREGAVECPACPCFPTEPRVRAADLDGLRGQLCLPGVGRRGAGASAGSSCLTRARLAACGQVRGGALGFSWKWQEINIGVGIPMVLLQTGGATCPLLLPWGNGAGRSVAESWKSRRICSIREGVRCSKLDYQNHSGWMR